MEQTISIHLGQNIYLGSVVLATLDRPSLNSTRFIYSSLTLGLLCFYGTNEQAVHGNYVIVVRKASPLLQVKACAKLR